MSLLNPFATLCIAMNQAPNRDHQHGGMESVGELCQQMKSAMRRGSNWSRLTPGRREALDMICHKIARILSGADPRDPEHWTDIAGYAHAAMRALPLPQSTTPTP
jgi:hypothetical protein